MADKHLPPKIETLVLDLAELRTTLSAIRSASIQWDASAKSAAGQLVRFVDEWKQALDPAKGFLESFRLGIEQAMASLVGPIAGQLKPYERWEGAEGELLSLFIAAKFKFLQEEVRAGRIDPEDPVDKRLELWEGQNKERVVALALADFRRNNAAKIATAWLVTSEKTSLEVSDAAWIGPRLGESWEACLNIAGKPGEPAWKERFTRFLEAAAARSADQDSRGKLDRAIEQAGGATWYHDAAIALANVLYLAEFARMAQVKRRFQVPVISVRHLGNLATLPLLTDITSPEAGGLLLAEDRPISGLVLAPSKSLDYMQTLKASIEEARSYLLPECLHWIYGDALEAYVKNVLRGGGNGEPVGSVIEGGLHEVIRRATGKTDPSPRDVATGRRLFQLLQALRVPGLPAGMDASLLAYAETPAGRGTRPVAFMTYYQPALPNFGRVMSAHRIDPFKRTTPLPPWPRIVSKRPADRAGERWLWLALAGLLRTRCVDIAERGGVCLSPEDVKALCSETPLGEDQISRTIDQWVESGELGRTGSGLVFFTHKPSLEHLVTSGKDFLAGQKRGLRSARKRRGGQQTLGSGL